MTDLVLKGKGLDDDDEQDDDCAMFQQYEWH